MKKIIKLDNVNLLTLFIFVFLTQFSSINHEVIDWDESTFFVLSNYISEGSILYVDFWDGKPPLIFIYLSLFFKIFGNNLIVGRLAGDLLIFAIVLLIYKILSRYYSAKISMSSSMILIYLFSYDASQPTMSEHLGIFFILISMFMILRDLDRLNYFYIGVLFSLAFNTRNNLAFSCLGIFLFLLIVTKKSTLKNFPKLFFGFITPIFVFIIYFSFLGSVKNYLYMLVEFPIQNTANRYTLDELKSDIYTKLNLDKFVSIEVIILTLLSLSLFYFFIFNKKVNTNNLLLLNMFIFSLTLTSIIAGGRFYSHYLIQLFPFVAIFIAFGLNLIKKFPILNLSILIFSILLNINLLTLGIRNINNFTNIKDNYPLLTISNYIDENNLYKKEILVLDSHLIYFYNNNLTSPKVIHPSNQPDIKRNQNWLKSLNRLGVISMFEFETKLSNIPDLILCNDLCFEYLDDNYFNENYVLDLYIDGVSLYKKNNS